MKKGSKLKLYSEFATRDKISLYEKLFTSLPDPDRILAENGYNYEIYRDLLTDPHLAATIQQRKMQVMQMGWEIYQSSKDGKRSSQKDLDDSVVEECIEFIQELDLQKIMSDILDALFFGYSIGEITWKLENDRIVPRDIVAKPQEWFIFDLNNKLKLRTRVSGDYVFEAGEDLPEYKFLVTQYQPTYMNPYGTKLLTRCYWPVTFKRAGIEQWHLLGEKFGVPIMVGYYAATATETEKEELLNSLLKMIEDNVAVAKEGTTIDFKENPKFEIGQLFERLAEFHNKEISKAILTVTLTTDVGRTGSYKASEVHREMLSYLGIADKKLVELCMNKLLRLYVDLNYGKEIASPKMKLQRKEYVIKESEQRDMMLRKMGVKFTKGYYMKRYNLSDGDFEIEA